jgi:hypothetical protein
MGQATFPISGGQIRIPLQIRGGDGQMKQIDIIYDPGDDITLLTAKTCNQIGLDPSQMQGSQFPVSGITQEPIPFTKITNLIQIGNLRPIWIPMGLAQADKFPENLLGRKGIMDGPYTIIQDESSITFQEKGPPVAMLANSGGRINSALRSAFRTNVRTW